MLVKKIKTLLIKLSLVFTLTASILIPNLSTHKMVYANTYNNNTRIEQRISNTKKVLIYSSHTCESFVDSSSITDVGRDLASKLIAKGIDAKYIDTDFSTNYNKSYDSSRNYLKAELLNNSYDLIIDLHRDALPTQDAVVVNGNPVSRVMAVIPKQSPNFSSTMNINNEITKSLNAFSKEIVKNPCLYYNKGYNYFNQDLKEGCILLELGNDKNDSLQNRRCCTYLASAINSYFENNK